ncbi:cytochrome P450 [Xylariaceae sp. FL0594]|nr:cytochrome P450 [Xylariaceae sp. FL0594]
MDTHKLLTYLSPSFLLSVALLVLLYSALCLLYNIYSHPLARVPGPLWWRASRVRFLQSFLAGNLVADVHELHKRYGDIVRIAPNEVSFAREEVWAEALGGRKPLPRNATFFKTPPGQSDNLVMTADPEASARMRQVISPAFTERAVARQERVPSQSEATEGAVIDLVDWFHWFAFDLVGELSFGEAFGCLRETKNHPWISRIFGSIKMSAFAAATRYYSGLEPLLMRLIPRRILKMQDDHFAFAKAKVRHRMQLSKLDDFMTPMLEQNPNFTVMSISEIESTMAVLVLAGSETTATTLCGICNCLVQSPAQLHRLEDEIRAGFSTEQDITLQALQKLPFLNSVIWEGLRMCNPVAGGILREVPDGGAMSIRPAAYANDRRSNQKPFGFGPRSCLGQFSLYVAGSSRHI